MSASSRPDTEAIDRLYLELSQFTTATTAKEIAYQKGIGEARSAAMNLCYAIEELPASEQQTKVSIQASDLVRQLNELLP
jgi:hypothetical protein